MDRVYQVPLFASIFHAHHFIKSALVNRTQCRVHIIRFSFGLSLLIFCQYWCLNQSWNVNFLLIDLSPLLNSLASIVQVKLQILNFRLFWHILLAIYGLFGGCHFITYLFREFIFIASITLIASLQASLNLFNLHHWRFVDIGLWVHCLNLFVCESMSIDLRFDLFFNFD